MSTKYWTSAKTIRRETLITGEIKNLSPLRIGTGEEQPLSSIVDLAVIRINIGGKQIPYIPGSSLKGVFRTQAQILANKKGIPTCTGLSKETCIDKREYYDPEQQSNVKLGKYIERIVRRGESEKAMEAFFKTACILCKIFGSPSYSSKTIFSDAYPTTEPTLDYRTGIAISRVTGAVAEKALYQVEYINPGARFTFKIHARNLPNYALGLLASIIKSIKEGEIRIGGFKTRGFGEVTIENIKFKTRGENDKLNLLSMEDGVDIDVDASQYARIENEWIISEGNQCWILLDKLAEVWEVAKLPT